MTDSADQKKLRFTMLPIVAPEIAREMSALDWQLTYEFARTRDNKTGFSRITLTGRSTLAEKLGVANRSVTRSIARLEGFQLLAVDRRVGRPSTYRLIFNEPVTPESLVTSESPVTQESATGGSGVRDR